MKTIKSIQKNQKQLNSLLMEKWGYKKKEELGEQTDYSKQPDAEQEALMQKAREKEPDYVPPETKNHVLSGEEAEKVPEPKPYIGEETLKEQESTEEENGKTHTKVTTTPMDGGKIAQQTVDQMNKGKGLEEGEKKDHDGDGDIDSDDYMAAKDKAIKANLEEQHNCKSAHPGMNHAQWSNKYR